MRDLSSRPGRIEEIISGNIRFFQNLEFRFTKEAVAKKLSLNIKIASTDFKFTISRGRKTLVNFRFAAREVFRQLIFDIDDDGWTRI